MENNYNNSSEKDELSSCLIGTVPVGIYVVAQKSYKLLYANKEMEEIFANAGIYDYLGVPCYSAFKKLHKPCEECIISLSENMEKDPEIYLDFLSKYYSAISHPIKWHGIPANVIYLSD
ncbi:MAG: hypothetical protein RR315_08845, partial [Oscillospiraceae bacterium]